MFGWLSRFFKIMKPTTWEDVKRKILRDMDEEPMPSPPSRQVSAAIDETIGRATGTTANTSTWTSLDRR